MCWENKERQTAETKREIIKHFPHFVKSGFVSISVVSFLSFSPSISSLNSFFLIHPMSFSRNSFIFSKKIVDNSRWPFAFSYFQQSSDHGPHHIPEKSIGLDLIDDFVPFFVNLRVQNTSNGMKIPVGWEGGKVCFSNKEPGSRFHLIRIEWRGPIQDIPKIKGIYIRSVVDSVLVDLWHRHFSGVEISIDLLEG